MACINLHPLDDFVPRCVGAQWRTSIPNATSGGSNEKGPEFPRAISGLHRGGRCLAGLSIGVATRILDKDHGPEPKSRGPSYSAVLTERIDHETTRHSRRQRTDGIAVASARYDEFRVRRMCPIAYGALTRWTEALEGAPPNEKCSVLRNRPAPGGTLLTGAADKGRRLRLEWDARCQRRSRKVSFLFSTACERSA